MSAKTRSSTDVETIYVELSGPELRKYGDEIATKVEQVENIEKEKKSVNSEYKIRIDDLIEEVRYLAQCIRRQTEQRDVEVETRVDYATGTVTRSRTDTGELLSERKLEPGEMQLPVDIGVIK